MRTSLAVLVPVLNRPQNVVPLLNSFLSSRTPGKLVFVVEVTDIDERRAVEQVAHFTCVDVVQVVDAHTWPEKINVGIREIDADWYLCAADDVAFGVGWWDATEPLRKNRTVNVIGTNDLGNPRVVAGEHTCHPLVRHDYARGPNLDGGPFCVETVHHWYSDDLIVATAKHREAWAMCGDAHVIHHHPYWDKTIPWDDTYTRGEASAETDQKAAVEWANTWLR